MIPHHIVCRDSWVAKESDFSTIDPALWRRLRAEEKAYVEGGDVPNELTTAFELGGIEFGRVDYGIVNGSAEIYEINTNPMVENYARKPEPLPAFPRQTIIAHANRSIIQALSMASISTAGSVSVRDINFLRAIPFVRVWRR